MTEARACYKTLHNPTYVTGLQVAFGISSHVLRIPAPTVCSAEAWAIKNTMLAAENYLLAATSHGLSSCPMEGFDGR